jgi:hypothetical protein
MDGKIERKGEGDNNEVDKADCNSGSFDRRRGLLQHGKVQPNIRKASQE